MCRPFARGGFAVALVFGVLTLFSQAASASIIFEIDTDGLDDGTVTYNPNFSFGGGQTSATQSASSSAVGLTGGDSIFGGNGSPDTYIMSYTPGTDADNQVFAPGTNLGNGNTATGLTGGVSGEYAVYATWPVSTNVTGGLTNYVLSDGITDLLTTTVDQQQPGGVVGGDWVLLGTANLLSGTTYTITQTPTNSTFVSMRAAGYMFELQPAAVPEPSSMILLGLCGVGAVGGRRLRKRRSS